MRKILLPIATVLTLFCACTESEVVDSPSSDLVSFGTYVGQATRASSVANLDDLKEQHFKVAACYTGADLWVAAQGSATPNFMYNDAVTWDATALAWKYDHIKYWPKEGNVSFFAYSPQASTCVAFSGIGEAGIPHFTYTVPDAVGNQEDLLADQQTDKTHSDARVSFAFDHLLSKIGFKATLAGTYAGATVNVTELKVDYAASGIINKAVYTFADDNSASSIWTPEGTSFHAATSNILNTGNILLSTTGAPLNANDKFMMLLPQAVAADKMVAKVTYTVGYTDGTVVTNVESINLPACTWEPGKQYTYNFNITLTKVEFDVIEVTPWGDAAVVEITGVPTDKKINLEADAESKAVYATTGIASISHNGTKFSVTYEGTPVARAVSDIAGKLTFAPVAANTTALPIEEQVTVTMTDVLGNQSSMDFDLIQYPPLNLVQNDTPMGSAVALLYNSQRDIYSVDAVVASPSASFAIVGVANDADVVVTLNSSGFAYTKSASALAFTATNILAAGSDDQSASATVTLTSTNGNTKSYTISLTQAAPAALMNGGAAVIPGSIALQFKSTKAAHNSVNSYTVKNAGSVGGALVGNGDFSVTKNTSTVSIVPQNELTAAGLTNKILAESTVVLTNPCGEIATYLFSATQYAAAYLKITKQDRTSDITSGSTVYVSATKNTQNIRYKSGLAYYTCLIEAQFESYDAPTVNGKKAILTAGTLGNARLQIEKSGNDGTNTLTITLNNAIEEVVVYQLEVDKDTIVSNGDKWE